jgi:hypothetical protein
MTLAGDPQRGRSGRLVELVGPAGAGKSTIFHALIGRDDSIEGRPSLRRAGHAAVFASETLAALATLLRYRAIGRGTTPEHIRMMAYLHALPRLLDGEGSFSSRTLVFDQGPVFFLTRPSLMDKRLASWHDRTFDVWASLLDVVVWLDAPDAVLTERINSRGKWHALKGAHGHTAAKVLTTSRTVYEDALSRLDGHRAGPTILRFDTSRHSANEIGEAVLSAFPDTGERPRNGLDTSSESSHVAAPVATTTDRRSDPPNGE